MSERFHLWPLSARGLSEVRPYLRSLAEEGFSSENHHHYRYDQAFSARGMDNSPKPKSSFLHRAGDAKAGTGKLSGLGATNKRALVRWSHSNSWTQAALDHGF